ncbi:MAG: hypothetical protein ABL867_04495 [Rickettsiales bacterium]
MIGDILSTTTDLSQGKDPIAEGMKNVHAAKTAIKVDGKSREQLVEMYNPKHECITDPVIQQVKKSGADEVLQKVITEVSFDKCHTPTAPNAISPRDMDDILNYRR